MSMDLRIKLMRIQDLEANIKATEEIYKRETARLEKMQEECNHEIVIVAGVPNPGYSVRAKCLFCGKHFSTPHDLRELPNKNLLDAYSCKKFEYYSENEIYNYITHQVNSITYKNSDVTIDELRDELQVLLS